MFNNPNGILIIFLGLNTAMLRKLFIAFLLLISSGVTAQKESTPFGRSMDSGYYYLGKFRAQESMKSFGDAVLIARQLNNDFFYAAALFGVGPGL